MKRNQIVLIIAVVALIALGAYYTVAVYLPAQDQAAQIDALTD